MNMDFILGLKGIENCTKKKKKNKMNKKRNGNSRKTDDTTALLPDNLSTNKY